MKERKRYRGKKGLSEIVSYVLLIVIALGLAVGVFAWFKFYLPLQSDDTTCEEGTTIVLKDYNCSIAGSLAINIENNGRFNIDGIILRASNDPGIIPAITLDSLSSGNCFSSVVPGRHYFCEQFSPQNSTTIYFNATELKPIARIQIQPFIKGERKLVLCSNIIDTNLEGC